MLTICSGKRGKNGMFHYIDAARVQQVRCETNQTKCKNLHIYDDYYFSPWQLKFKRKKCGFAQMTLSKHLFRFPHKFEKKEKNQTPWNSVSCVKIFGFFLFYSPTLRSMPSVKYNANKVNLGNECTQFSSVTGVGPRLPPLMWFKVCLFTQQGRSN